MRERVSPGSSKYPPTSNQKKESIVYRTRSKYNLHETPLEEIEKAFVPPDITTDMYDFDYELDDDWVDFLIQFTQPLEKVINGDDDPEADPDFKILGEEEAAAAAAAAAAANSNVSKDSDNLTGLTNLDSFHLNNSVAETTISQNEQSHHRSLNVSCSFDQSFQSTTSEPQGNVTSDPFNLTIPQNDITPDPCNIGQNDVTSVHQETTTHTQPFISNNSENNDSDIRQNDITSVHQETVTTQPFIPINSQNNYSNGLALELSGLNFQITPHQRGLLSVQMSHHIQLTAQQFLMTYKHPTLHQHSEVCKGNLQSLNYLSNETNSAYNAINLKEALELVADWEKKFEDPVFQTNYVKCLDDHIEIEIKMNKSSKKYKTPFPHELKKVMLESKALVHPVLLPSIFPSALKKGNLPYLRSEEYLVALGLEKYLPYVEKNNQSLFKTPQSQLADAIKLINQNLVPIRDFNSLHNFIKKYRKSAGPIAQVFEKGFVKASIHVFLPKTELISPNCQSLESLPQNWQGFANDLKYGSIEDFIRIPVNRVRNIPPQRKGNTKIVQSSCETGEEFVNTKIEPPDTQLHVPKDMPNLNETPEKVDNNHHLDTRKIEVKIENISDNEEEGELIIPEILEDTVHVNIKTENHQTYNQEEFLTDNNSSNVKTGLPDLNPDTTLNAKMKQTDTNSSSSSDSRESLISLSPKKLKKIKRNVNILSHKSEISKMRKRPRLSSESSNDSISKTPIKSKKFSKKSDSDEIEIQSDENDSSDTHKVLQAESRFRSSSESSENSVSSPPRKSKRLLSKNGSDRKKIESEEIILNDTHGPLRNNSKLSPKIRKPKRMMKNKHSDNSIGKKGLISKNKYSEKITSINLMSTDDESVSENEERPRINFANTEFSSGSESNSSEDIATKYQPWSKDEDKILLENIRKDYSSEMFNHLSTKLKTRSVNEMKRRCEYLLSLLRKVKQ